MIKLYIGGTDRTADLERNTIKVTNQIQQRTDQLDFVIYAGSKPLENQDVKLYLCDTIADISGATITLTGSYEQGVNRFYKGQIVYLQIGTATESTGVVLSYDEATKTLILTAAPAGVSIGDLVGDKVFGGVTSRVKDRNVDVLAVLEWDVTCVDHTKIFDKKNVADTWQNEDGRYIINDFVNSTVNYNTTVDTMSYASNAALQAVWAKTTDAALATIDTGDYLEATNSAVMAWTYSAGTAIWTGTLTAKNVSPFTGASSGAPGAGNLMLWIKPSDYTKITAIKIRLGSSSSNYTEITLPALTKNDWQYVTMPLKSGAVTGTPNWAAFAYSQIRVTETASASIKINGLRINADNSFTLKNVQQSIEFTAHKSATLKPTALMQALAKALQYIWWIDYDRDVHFCPSETMAAPFALTDASANFSNLAIEVDQSQLGNRVIVKGGEIESTSTYSQVFQGNNSAREWILKNKFSNLGISVDDNTTTKTSIAGTNTTNVTITSHGLVAGQHVTNRTRSVVRQVLTVVNANNFTVQAVPSQTTGDVFSYFATAKTDGVEGLTDETTVDYVSNYSRQSVRASSQTATLPSTTYIRFSYTEKVPIQVQYTDPSSANALKALGFGDGIFDLQPIVDNTISDLYTAVSLAQAKVQDYCNPIINGTFTTDQHGLQAGQVVSITDATRGISAEYLIQIVKASQKEGQFGDYFIYSVTFGTTLFGLIEFYQKLLAIQGNIEGTIDEVVETYVSAIERVGITEASLVSKGGGKTAASAEDVTIHEVGAVYKNTGAWHYEPSTGQSVKTRYNLCQYS